MKYRTMGRSSLDRLNRRARVLQRANPDWNGADAVKETADQERLIVVKRSDDAIVYKTPRNIYVNAWLEGPHSQDVQPGGAGFDDQIDWAFQG